MAALLDLLRTRLTTADTTLHWQRRLIQESTPPQRSSSNTGRVVIARDGRIARFEPGRFVIVETDGLLASLVPSLRYGTAAGLPAASFARLRRARRTGTALQRRSCAK